MVFLLSFLPCVERQWCDCTDYTEIHFHAGVGVMTAHAEAQRTREDTALI